VRDRVGDRWLGFKDDDLERLLKGAGLSDVSVRVGARLTGDPFTVLIAKGVKILDFRLGLSTVDYRLSTVD
jgi:hypothetical protein